ncbi:MAG: HD domain-containing protein [Chloroflexota bacterium]|nr:HD domain-containing protein [Chloroflexota bacterium]
MTSPQDPFPYGDALRAAADLHNAREVERLDAAGELVLEESGRSELRVLVAAREQLAMDVAYCSHFTAFEQVVESADGDAASFGLTPGTRIALGDTYSQRVVDGRLPNLITDARRDERVSGLATTDGADIGAFIGVPVRLSDGRLYGTLCCASHTAAPWLGDGDVAFMRVLGGLLADEVERRAIERAMQRHGDEAIALGALFAGLHARDNYTGSHSEEVVELALKVTRELGMPESFVQEVKQVALLHDIGKIGIPDAILAKPGALTDAEWQIMHMHPAIGEQIVASIATLAPLAPAIRAEHERCDGNGYPDGLTRQNIPLASRITFACDAYHAMISSRPYRRKPLLAAAAAGELQANAGTQFDPDVITALLRVLKH